MNFLRQRAFEDEPSASPASFKRRTHVDDFKKLGFQVFVLIILSTILGAVWALVFILVESRKPI